MRKYLPCIVDQLLQKVLKPSGAVLMEGPKWCGKTWTVQQTALINPSLLLEGETPRLLDECQLAPTLWNAVRSTVDKRDKTGPGSDAVLVLRDGRGETIKNMKKFVDSINTDKMNEPSFFMNLVFIGLPFQVTSATIVALSIPFLIKLLP